MSSYHTHSSSSGAAHNSIAGPSRPTQHRPESSRAHRPSSRSSHTHHKMRSDHQEGSSAVPAETYSNDHGRSSSRTSPIHQTGNSIDAFERPLSTSQHHRARTRNAHVPSPSPSPLPMSLISATAPTYVQALHSFDPANLPSTSTGMQGMNNMYLKFKAGEVIRVWSKDEKGWWDGEITAAGAEDEGRGGPRRGWFPSNYVKEIEPETLHARTGSMASVDSNRHRPDVPRHSSTVSLNSHKTNGSRTYGHRRSLSRHRSYESHRSRDSTGFTDVYQAVLLPVDQSLRVLDEAIRENHVSHFQPATAHIISTIRGALEQMDCLSKDSPTLTRLPQLRKERKFVLVELSKLVACARAASGVIDADSPVAIPPGEELDALENSAGSVFDSMKRVMVMASDYGVVPQPRKGKEGDKTRIPVGSISMHESIPSHSSEMSRPPSVNRTRSAQGSERTVGASHNRWSEKVRSPPPGNPRIHDTFRRKMSSTTDLRSMKRRDSSPPPVPASLVSARSTISSSSGASFHRDAASFHTHDRDRVIGSMDSTFSHASSEGLGSAFEPAPPRSSDLSTLDGIFDAIQQAEDALYSTMAAFIGQIHSHSRGAHPTAHAGLIRMTKLSVDCIREMLTVVETLGRKVNAEQTDETVGIDSEAQKLQRVAKLLEVREELYDLATRLVDSAEAVAEGGLAEPGEAVSYEEDKESLIHIASEGLRMAAGCACVVRWVLDPEEWDMPDKENGVYATPPGMHGQVADIRRRSGASASVNSVATGEKDEAMEVPSVVVPMSEEGTRRDRVVGVRGQHTLSGLGRRVDSLGGRWNVGQDNTNQTQTQGLLGVPIVPHATLSGWVDREYEGSDGEEYVRSASQSGHGHDTEEDGEGQVSMDDTDVEEVTVRHEWSAQSGDRQTRPPLLQTHSTPLLRTPQPAAAAVLERSPSDTPMPRSRSRSSSLASNIPPRPRVQHRSPNRSADLDKFTSDYPDLTVTSRFDTGSGPLGGADDTIRLPPRKESLAGRADVRSSVYTTASLASTSATRSSTLDFAGPRTPNLDMAHSPIIDYVRAEAALGGEDERDVALMKAMTLDPSSAPSKPVRAAPAPPIELDDVQLHLMARPYDPSEFNLASDGSIAAASLKVLVERMTPHDATPDLELSEMFWDTWRLHTTPSTLLDEVLSRYEARPAPALAESLERLSVGDRTLWVESRVIPTRIRCFALLKAWIDTYWRTGDEGETGDTLERIQVWNEEQEKALPAMSMRLGEAVRRREGQRRGSMGSSQAHGNVRTSIGERPDSRASSHSTSHGHGHGQGHGHGRTHSRGASVSSRGLRRSASFDRLRVTTATPISPTSPIAPLSALPPTPIITKSLHTLLNKRNGPTKSSGMSLAPINTALAQMHGGGSVAQLSGETATLPTPVTLTPGVSPHSANGSVGNTAIPTIVPLPPTPTIPLTEFDPLEMARQLTILELRSFRHLDPIDMLLCRAMSKKRSADKASTAILVKAGNDALRTLSTLSGQITGFVVDGILAEGETKKRAGLLKFWLKVADKCLALNNFSSLFAILAGLNSSTIDRLKKTWDALSAKHRQTRDRLSGVIEHTRNHAVYRSALREAMAGPGGVLPYLGLILTDITFTCDGNPDTRPSTLQPDVQLINIDKYTKLAKIASDFRRFHEPYNLHEIDAVQAYLSRALAERGSGSVDAMYRKSLKLEPRKNSEKISSTVDRPGWLGGRM